MDEVVKRAATIEADCRSSEMLSVALLKRLHVDIAVRVASVTA